MVAENPQSMPSSSEVYRWVLYPFMKLFLGVLLIVLGPVRVLGRGNVPRRGGLLILANHISDADPPTMAYAVPRPTYFMAKSELFSVRLLGRIIRAFRAFPVNRGTPDKAALRKTVELLRGGEAVVMFPEGECSETGHLLPLLPGAALIVRMAGSSVICAGIKGTSRIMPYGKLIPKPAFGGVRVSFGEPKVFPQGASQEEILGWARAEFERLTA
jgi:1-acyl-sn-glycerol-3-phosphate acyltransferase